jgi:lipopolysaccharide export system protein LptA
MMRKRILLASATVALCIVAYLVLTAGDIVVAPRTTNEGSQAVRQFVSKPTTQVSQSISDSNINFSPGDQTRVRVYDELTGRLKYQFDAKTWEPTSNTDFHLRDILIQIFMPRGEITYISADEAQVALSRKSKNRVEPKSGWLRGNVRVTLDRTTSAWRTANPELAERYAHPDELINIELADASFDLDQAELTSDGEILVDSSEARIENVRGLTVQWDQLDNRIDVLHFKQGGKMHLRRGGRMVDFGLPGSDRGAKKDGAGGKSKPPAGKTLAGQMEVPKAYANRPMKIEAVSAEEAAEEIRLEGGVAVANQPKSLGAPPPSTVQTARKSESKLGTTGDMNAAVESMRTEARGGTSGEIAAPGSALATALKGRKRINTYRAVFNNQVVVEQKEGLRTIGKIEASKLEINFDFGRKQRDMGAPSTPRAGATSQPVEPPSQERTSLASLAAEDDSTKLVLTWNGPLDLRPLRVDPDQQSGQRFDAVATGAPVKVQSDQGSALCKQLVYRHERRQVWLSSDDGSPVELGVTALRKLVGREIFFDQKRGLARVDGAGRMIDLGEEKVSEGIDEVETAKPKKPRDPVEIVWNRGVDIEIAMRPTERIDPDTGARTIKQKEFLRRAWFHGEVGVKQGKQQLEAEEVAVTFGLPQSNTEVADHIENLNLSGKVRLFNTDDSITADQLDVKMALLADGRNVPSLVDGSGSVTIKQTEREIRANQMHVVLAPIAKPAKGETEDRSMVSIGSGVGVESLDATGDVYVRDPVNNLKISRAKSLQCRMRGRDLVTTNILSDKPEIYARARFGDMAIHGHRIDINTDEQTVDVPGPGAAWMLSREDFGGKKLAKPEPVRITWRDRMQFKSGRDYGVFEGKVRTKSETFAMACDRLSVHLGAAPPEPPRPKTKMFENVWLLRKIVAKLAEHIGRDQTPAMLAQKKEPKSIIAEGSAMALSNTHAPKSMDGRPGRLTSRAMIRGEKINVDLGAQQMSVPGKGDLLIEDYQFETSRSPTNASLRSRSGPLLSSARDSGPSQTLVQWENSMDYYVDSSLVVFDKNVMMRHVSGQELVLGRELAESMHLDAESLKRLERGRKATLSSGNLTLEFRMGEKKRGREEDVSLMRATDLERLIAKHAVHLQDGTRSLMGEHLQYIASIDEVRLEGNDTLEARITDQDEITQRLNMWRGPLLIWNRTTNSIEAPQANIRSSR